MVLRIKSLKELGSNVRVMAGLKTQKRSVRIPKAESVPQARLWKLVKEKHPDAEQEKKGVVPNRRFIVDIVIERLKLVVEVDGWLSHGMRKAGFARDREKDRLLLIAGYRTVRFTAGEILKTPDKVMEILADIVAVIEKEKEVRGGEESN